MSQLDELVARSRSPGKLVERRSFTLSRDKAIEKQREFALRHPRQYVLELVQCAVFAGATYLAIDTRPQSLLVAWVGGRPLEARALEDLFDWLFADRGDRRWRHLVQLAIGVNALLQRRPRTLRIESGDGQQAVRLDLDAKGRATLGVPAEPIAGTYLYAEHETGWFGRFAASTSTEEQQLVEERCLYTPVPILLNGSAPFGYRGSRHIEIFGARAQEYFDEAQDPNGRGRRGVVAVHASDRAPVGFRMVVGGVWISTLPLEPLADRPLVGVVCDDWLRKTADQSDIVQDHRYVEMLHAVQPHATRLLRRLDGPGYRPPPLPPIPRVEEKTAERAPELGSAEPLPDPIPSARPRGPCTLDELRRAAHVPVFRVAPEHVDKLGASIAPEVFPWRVLVLTDGQARTLAEELPGVPIHRLTARADVDFARRVVERGMRVRERAIQAGARTIVLRLHLDGPLPDWGQGRPGVPFCVVAGEHTLEHGVIEGAGVRIVGGRPGHEPERTLQVALALPRVSILVRHPPGTPWRRAGGFDEACAEAVLAHAHLLAAPEGEDPHPELLAALLAAQAVPHLAPDDGAVRLGVSLPVGWPDQLLAAPLARTADGGRLSLGDLLALAGTDRVVALADLDELRALDALEQRLGYGHLTHPALEGEPLFGAGRIGERWIWLDEPASWANPAIEQLVWVGATFAPRDHDARFRPGPRPHPILVGAVREGATPTAWEDGFGVLFDGLQRIEAERAWTGHARPPVGPGRVEGLGRLALVALAALLGRDTVPLLVPSDGGGRRSLSEIRTHPAARVVARRGIRLAEPWTFAVTCDELRAIGPARLRYDDGPEVWRSLPESERGWLVRHEVRAGGLRGWLGLRVPHDGTTGVLLRSTGELVALSELERSIPCHGLLWPEEGTAIGPEQRRLAQLAGLRLYQSLATVLAEDRDPERVEAARRYATTFSLLAWRRAGRLQGTALDLARRVEVRGPDGRPAGTLEQWLATPPELRPPLPDEVLPRDEADAPELPAVTAAGEGDEALAGRLRAALGPAAPVVSIEAAALGAHGDPFVLEEGRSHRGRVVIRTNLEHPLIAAARTPGPARELLLVALARRICAWGRAVGLGLDLAHAQQVLLAQRFAA